MNWKCTPPLISEPDEKIALQVTSCWWTHYGLWRKTHITSEHVIGKKSPAAIFMHEMVVSSALSQETEGASTSLFLNLARALHNLMVWSDHHDLFFIMVIYRPLEESFQKQTNALPMKPRGILTSIMLSKYFIFHFCLFHLIQNSWTLTLIRWIMSAYYILVEPPDDKRKAFGVHQASLKKWMVNIISLMNCWMTCAIIFITMWSHQAKKSTLSSKTQMSFHMARLQIWSQQIDIGLFGTPLYNTKTQSDHEVQNLWAMLTQMPPCQSAEGGFNVGFDTCPSKPVSFNKDDFTKFVNPLSYCSWEVSPTDGM